MSDMDVVLRPKKAEGQWYRWSLYPYDTVIRTNWQTTYTCLRLVQGRWNVCGCWSTELGFSDLNVVCLWFWKMSSPLQGLVGSENKKWPWQERFTHIRQSRRVLNTFGVMHKQGWLRVISYALPCVGVFCKLLKIGVTVVNMHKKVLRWFSASMSGGVKQNCYFTHDQ